ncbi:MAG: hypothetical protein NTU44_03180 [Bacteroidetes bacterium]|nr:hypothetical protein [Bacteroidota bacterium]
MKKLFTLLIPVLLFAAGSTYGQVSAYTFAQSTTTYTALTNGTVPSGWSGSSMDDATLSGIPIGFTFNINNTNFTTLTMSQNGYVMFGYASSLGYQPISSTTAFTGGLLSGLANDLQGTATAEVMYKTEGTSPNRTFTVQFKDFKGYGSSSYLNCLWNFQFILQETTNKMFIKYGSFVYPTSASPTSNTFQVGLRGNDANDFNNRSVTSSWASSSAGTSNTATCLLSNTVLPSSGLTFAYTPPSILPPSGFTAAAVSSTQINLGWTLNAAGNNVMLAYSTTGVFGTPVDGTTYNMNDVIAGGGTVLYSGNATSYQHINLTPATKYFYKLYSFNGALAYSNGASANATTWCVPATLPYNEGFEGISANNEYPTCWTSTNLGSKTFTYTGAQGSYNRFANSGSKFGAFYYNCNDWFFTRQIHLVAGQTYMAGIYYITDGYSGWLNLNIYYGATANAAGMTNLVAATTNMSNTSYQQLNNTFTATVTGDYYFGIQCVSNGVPWYLSIDDFSVALLTVPNCAINPNPANGATNINRNATISWANGGLATDYDVYYGTTNPPAFQFNTTSTSFVPGTAFPANTLIYWKIVPHNFLGYATGCTTWSFTTNANLQYCTSSATSTAE